LVPPKILGWLATGVGPVGFHRPYHWGDDRSGLCLSWTSNTEWNKWAETMQKSMSDRLTQRIYAPGIHVHICVLEESAHDAQCVVTQHSCTRSMGVGRTFAGREQ